jgi:hypothetical protein
MKHCSGSPLKTIIFSRNNNETFKELISKNREEFVEYLYYLGLNVTHEAKTTDAQNHSTTTITLRTTCFKVDFNDNFAKISALK